MKTNWPLLKISCIYLLCAVLFYFAGDDQLKYKYDTSPMDSQTGVLDELSEGIILSQSFKSKTETLDAIDIKFATYGRKNSGNLYLYILDSNDTPMAQQTIFAGDLVDGELYRWNFSSIIDNAKNKDFQLVIKSSCRPGQSPSVYYSSLNSETNYTVNGEIRTGSLSFSHIGKEYFFLGDYYWQSVFIGLILITFYYIWFLYRNKIGKRTLVSWIFTVWKKYDFLIKQLVSRDFKTKYKRSVLGYLWSFLNPLLTMAVQYIVFSTIFRSGIENFPVYLLSGIIIFNFFQESVGQGLLAIVANASLITKVYMPKYIYPVTKVVSCSINLFISIIPLLMVTILTGTPITKAIILVPYALLCLLVFCIGMSMLLSTAMVFFRDTQYLWGIISLAWMYATPLFYPENIIPAHFRFIQTLNPIYHYVRFVRVILINGVSPEPKAYLVCGASALLMCVIGGFVFKRHQDKFVLFV